VQRWNHIAALMGHFSSAFNRLAKSFATKRGGSSDGCNGREAAEAMAKEAKKNHFILHSSGTINVDGSNNFASLFSKKGKKGVNQDCCVVWEVCSNIEYFPPYLTNVFFSYWGIYDTRFLLMLVTGIWVPRGHDLLRDFWRARAMGSLCGQESERVNATIFAMQLAGDTFPNFTWSRCWCWYWDREKANPVQYMEALLLEDLCCHWSRTKAKSQDRFIFQRNNCLVHC